jgi:dephospho-CoA kinase
LWEIAKLWMRGCRVVILDNMLLFQSKMDPWTNLVIVIWVNAITKI